MTQPVYCISSFYSQIFKCVCVYIYTHIQYIYIYIYINYIINVCVYIYIYIYIILHPCEKEMHLIALNVHL